ncbi:hypothetical protein POM88_008143 [Heracleum sosnowskyi]|uniref:Uncharacterized protein n=1 Tax=Heracleum sosnowskyi TaxID=360622 RepID=A0AAD8N1G5_9APIA|nr:hypothetical protein POM88_008143 [Heracleum sosnowskyi]
MNSTSKIQKVEDSSSKEFVLCLESYCYYNSTMEVLAYLFCDDFMKISFFLVVFSFKKPSNVQGSQTRVVNSDIRSDATTGGNVVVSGSARSVQNGAHLQSFGGSDAPVVVKQNVPPMQKVNRGVPKAPAPNSSTPVSSNTAAPSTPAKGGGFPLQFGSISPGLMQVPARTSSAPLNLDEQKREQKLNICMAIIKYGPYGPSHPVDRLFWCPTYVASLSLHEILEYSF